MREKTKNRTIELVGILFILTVISICISSRLVARYTTKASASDIARTAKFQTATDVGMPSNPNVVAGREWTDVVDIIAQAESETKVEYQFQISNLPEGAMAVVCDENMVEVSKVAKVPDGESKVLIAEDVFEKKFTIEPNNSHNKKYKVKLFFPTQDEEKNKRVNVAIVYNQVK